MNAEIATLDNGLAVIKVDVPHLESATTLLAVGAGSRYETKKNGGIAHFLEHMAFKGTKKFPTALEISSAVEGRGGLINASTSKEVIIYYIKIASTDFTLTNEILSSMIKEPLFDPEEIEKEKKVVIEELRMYRDDPGSYAPVLYERLQFGDQPLGWDIGGEEETVSSFNGGDFIKYMDSLYSPENMALAFVGKLPKDTDEILKENFGNLPAAEKGLFVPYKKDIQRKPRIGILEKDTSQANIVLGVEGYNYFDERRYAAEILADVLGGGMSSRLFQEIRGRRSLAYRINSGSDTYYDAGSFNVTAGLNAQNIHEGIGAIKAELEKLTREKIAPEELSRVKNMIKGITALRMEGTNFIAGSFAGGYVLKRKIGSYDKALKLLEEVTPDDVQYVARDLFRNERYNLQIIGPVSDAEPFYKILSS